MIEPAIAPETLTAIRELEPSRNLQPVERLVLAVLQQAVLDYHSNDEVQQRDALRYFRESVLYKLTLQLFDLPRDTLPLGVDLDGIPQRPEQARTAAAELAPETEELLLNDQTIPLLTLMKFLKGNRLHVFLTIYLLGQPVSIADVAVISGISEDTVRRQIGELQDIGLLVDYEKGEVPKSWVIAPEAASIIVGQTGQNGY